VATGVALSAAIVTFAFATFAASRVANLGGSLSDFARTSGLLVAIAIGLIAIAACGASLVVLPAAPPTPSAAISRLASASAVAATVVSAAGFVLIPVVLRQSLHAADRSWFHARLQRRLESGLDRAVARFIEHSYARALLVQTMAEHRLGAAPLTDPAAPYRPGRHPRRGVVADIHLHRLVKLRDSWAGGDRCVLLNPILAHKALDYETTPQTPLLWVAGHVYSRDIRRIFVVKEIEPTGIVGDDLDLLQAEALTAVRDDDEVWYRQIAHIHRSLLGHLVVAWRRFGAAPGRAPAEDEVGLRPLAERLEAQAREIAELDREELAMTCVDVFLSVGLEALAHPSDGGGLATRMMLSLGRVAVYATAMPSATAQHLRRSSSDAVFMLLRAANGQS